MRFAPKLIFTVFLCFANVYSSDNTNNLSYFNLPSSYIDPALEITDNLDNTTLPSCLTVHSFDNIDSQLKRLHNALYLNHFDKALEIIDSMQNIHENNNPHESVLLTLMKSFNKHSFNKESLGYETPFNEEDTNTIYEIIQKLIQKGANVEAKTVNHKTPLMCAAYFTNLEIVKLLIQHDANVNAQDSSGYCPLYLAIANHKFDIALHLINEVPITDLNLQTVRNHSFIHIAIQKENISIVKALIEHGIFPTKKEWKKMRRHFSIKDIKTELLTNEIKKKFPSKKYAMVKSMMTAWQEQDDSSISNIFSPLTVQIPHSTHASPSHSSNSSPQKFFTESESRKEATRYSFYKVRSPEEEDYLKESFLDDDFDLERSYS